jgi:hypothetical protein
VKEFAFRDLRTPVDEKIREGLRRPSIMDEDPPGPEWYEENGYPLPVTMERRSKTPSGWEDREGGGVRFIRGRASSDLTPAECAVFRKRMHGELPGIHGPLKQNLAAKVDELRASVKQR